MFVYRNAPAVVADQDRAVFLEDDGNVMGGLGDGFVAFQLLDQQVRLGGEAAAENGALGFAQHADLVALLAAVIPLRILAELVNIGTLLAFVIVCGAVLVMRKTDPDASRPFRCPMVPLVPLLGIGTCLVLMFSLPVENWLRLIVWLILGFVIYFFYSRHHSVLAKARRNA